MADLESMTRDDLYGHYRRYYAPNNAIAVAVGDFKTRDMLARIEANCSAAPSPRRCRSSRPRPEPEQKGERRVQPDRRGRNRLRGRRCTTRRSATDPDFYPMVALDSILAGASNFNFFGGGTSNKSSRLYRALVETGLAAGVSAGLSPTVDPYLYCSSPARSATGRRPRRWSRRSIREIERARSRAGERRRSWPRRVKQARAMFAYGAESVTNQGYWLGVHRGVRHATAGSRPTWTGWRQ